ncbi:hypothetical protein CRM22_006982 [Opisthorchis felineus]|uniref:Uncharacterized protein n=1 Tax=Opisthorchis felineus TaxID=147828 RepID=A0A4S2LI98_OPIFE|nr:hypothetical protein CRM22_006982 [Opisthorchis felineus]
MQLDLNSSLDEIILAIQNWNSNAFLGFAPCLHKLSCPQDHPADKLCFLLEVLCTQVKLLPPTMISELLQTVSDPAVWIYCDPSLSSAMINFLTELAVNFTALLSDVCDICVQLILMKPIVANPKRCRIQAPICSMVALSFTASLLSIVPQSEATLTDRIISKFPGWRKPLSELILTSSNVLCLIASQSTSRWLSIPNICSLLGTIFKLIVDLELSPDHPSHTVPEQPSLSCEAENLCMSALQNRVYEIVEQVTAKEGTSVSKLEILTWIVMTQLRTVCTRAAPNSLDTNNLDWSVLCSVFKRMRSLFAQFVLPVNIRIEAFPLLCLYTASLRGGLMINWTEFLWNTIKDDQQDCGTRVTAVAYLVSLLSRIRTCPSDLVIELLHDMTRWCVDYVYRHRGLIVVTNEAELLVTEHRLYYAVCHAIFYIIVQLHGTLLDNEYYRASCETLPLAQIMLSPLSPLENTPTDLRWAFERIISTYHLSCASMSVSPVFSIVDRACGDVLPTTLDTCLLADVRPSQLFSLPFQSKLCLIKPFVQHLFRDFVLGKRFSAATDASSKTNTGGKLKRKRQPYQGVDVRKLARIASGNF